MDHWEQLSPTPFRVRGLLPRGGTHYVMHRKHSSGSHRTYGILGAEPKTGKGKGLGDLEEEKVQEKKEG